MIADKIQLTRLADLDGKTIKPSGIGDDWDYVSLQFTDNSFIVLRAKLEYEDPVIEVLTRPIKEYKLDPTSQLKLKLVTTEEHSRLKAEQERKEREATERHERETLERLMKKYGQK